MKLWQTRAPVYGKSTDEEVIKFIDTYITCCIPSEHENPNLFDLVTRFQNHNCTKSCKRYMKKKIK